MQAVLQSLRGLRVRGLVAFAVASACVFSAVLFGAPRSAWAATSRHEAVTATVPVSAVLAGDKADEVPAFMFEMTPTDDESVAPAESQVTADAEGNASFSLTFDRVGEHHYTVRQVTAAADRWTLDSQVYDVTVYCMWNEKTDDLFTTVIIKDAQGTKAESCSFANAYDAPEAPATPAPKPETNKPVPTTGDATNVMPIVALACVGVVLVCGGVWFSRRKRDASDGE